MKVALCLGVMTRGTHIQPIISIVRCTRNKGYFTPKSSSRWRLDKVSTHKDSSWPQKSMPKAPRDWDVQSSSSMELSVMWRTSGVVESMDGKKRHAWPTIGADTSTLRRSHILHTQLSRMRNSLSMTCLTSQRMRNNQTMRLMTRPPWGTWETQRLLSPCRSASWPISHQALIQDRVFNAPVLEKLQIPPENPSESNLRLFTASELAHLGSHLSIITNILARQANPDENLSAISDELDREIPWMLHLVTRHNLIQLLSLAFWSNDPNPADQIRACIRLRRCIFQKSPAAAGRVCETSE